MSTALTKSRSQVSTPARNPFVALRREMDDLLSNFWDGEARDKWFSSAFAPTADLVEADNAFEIRMDIPGMDAKDIEVKVTGNTMTVSGQRKEDKEDKGKTWHCMERRTGSFSRTITLPCDVNEDEVAAEYVQGVLTVKLPKCEEAKTTKVTVKG